MPPSRFLPDWQPVANPDAVILSGNARFTLLTSRLIRLEYAPDGRFEDRPSQVFWYRDQPVPPFDVARDGAGVQIRTDHLHLRYKGGAFSADSLTITLRPSATSWQYGQDDPHNLPGTARTLDQVSGATPLEPGLISRSGWCVVDDSATLVFNAGGWLVPRSADTNTDTGCHDLYFFGYEQEYSACLRDYRRVAGQVPLIPRYILGNWWSRYWEYSQNELLGVVGEFAEHRVPLAVCIVDMDWHLVDNPHHAGWTGYTWNRTLFPDPTAFVRHLHNQGIATALNLHPADGVAAHEAAYREMAQRLGRDPESAETIPFDSTDPAFMQAYFELLHHPEEARGFDFWWMDWQQGKQTRLHGLDPLWWLNHLHFYDLGRDGHKRPFIFSRWGGLGNHRYPIGFSGDTHVTWESLAFQPHFTASAANVGYGWWSHDIGGHFFGMEDAELYTRWVQFGVFSPILRLHSTKVIDHERRPWGYDAETERITTQALRLRHSLIPYLYALAWRDHAEGECLIRPMYHTHPADDRAYTNPQQYRFGPDLIVAPFVTPADPATRMAAQRVWLPPGNWCHLGSSTWLRGDRELTWHGPLDDIPVFAPAGAIVPLAADALANTHLDNPVVLVWRFFAGADGAFTLYEDDGKSQAYRTGGGCRTQVRQERADDGPLVVTFAAPEGEVTHLPERRSHVLVFEGVGKPAQVQGQVDGRLYPVQWEYDSEHGRLLLSPITVGRSADIRITLHTAPLRPDRRLARLHDVLRRLRLETMVKMGLRPQLEAFVAGNSAERARILDGLSRYLTESQREVLLNSAELC
jgi:alpha-glucosidase (family GH31 glycosyl hydrolase)